VPGRIFALSLCLAVAASASAQTAPAASPAVDSDHAHSHDRFDIRFGDDGARADLARDLETPVQRRRVAAIEELERTVPGLSVDLHPVTGAPKFLRSTRGTLTAPVERPIEPRAILREFVLDRADLFSLSAASFDASRVTRLATDERTGASFVRLQQTLEGVDIHGAELRAAIDADGALVAISAGTVSTLGVEFAAPAPRLSRADAIRAAADHVEIELGAVPAPLDPAPLADHSQRFEKGDDLQRPIDTRFVYFPLTARTLRPAFSILISERGSADVFEVLVDARTGAILTSVNHTVYEGAMPATYRVFTSDSPAPMTPGPASPDGAQASLVSRELLTLDAVDAIASPEGWIPAGDNETLGNNVDAHLDLNNDDDPDLPRPQGSPTRVFDFPIDFGQNPSAYEDAAVTQMFYTTNWFHDRLYQLGFTEQFANFQSENFERGGAGGDPVSADVQDGGDVNNANFFTLPTDGSFSRVQMYLWPGPTPTRDGSLDVQIIIHELVHGLTIRLAGPFSTTQSRGLGEGWSDFVALAMLAEPGDDPDGVYTIAGYSTFEGDPGFDDNYYFGIRRYPYTTDMARNPVTFNDIDENQIDVDSGIPRNPAFGSSFPGQVHNIGTVWCSTLWECRANFIDRYGFEGNEIFLQLVVDALKLTPFNPNFIQARDAVLLADIMTNGGENLCILWEGFATRGLGAGASSPASVDAVGVSESFATPDALVFEFPGGRPNRVSPGISEIGVNILATCATLQSDSPTLNLAIDGGSFQQILMTEDGQIPGRFIASTPALTCGQSVEYYISASADGQTFTDPPGAPANASSLAIATGDEMRFADDFETDLGWTVTGDASDGQWERAFPSGAGDRGDPFEDADGSGFCFVTNNDDGNSDVDGGQTILTSPLLDATGGRPVLSYFRWWSNDYGDNAGQELMTIEVSNDDGANWTTIETVADSVGDWVAKSILLDEFIAPTNEMRVRFIAADLSGAIVEGGVDGVGLDLLTCEAGAGPDLDGDGMIGSGDLAILLGAWGPCPAEPAACPADLDGDGSVGSGDLAIVLGAWG